jgi:hypothetical protein
VVPSASRLLLLQGREASEGRDTGPHRLGLSLRLAGALVPTLASRRYWLE